MSMVILPNRSGFSIVWRAKSGRGFWVDRTWMHFLHCNAYDIREPRIPVSSADSPTNK